MVVGMVVEIVVVGYWWWGIDVGIIGDGVVTVAVVVTANVKLAVKRVVGTLLWWW